MQPDSESSCHCQLRQFKTNISKVFTILHKFLGTPWGPIGQDSLPNSKKIKMQKACKHNVCRLSLAEPQGDNSCHFHKHFVLHKRLIFKALSRIAFLPSCLNLYKSFAKSSKYSSKFQFSMRFQRSFQA